MARYTRELVRALGERPDVELVLVAPAGARASLADMTVPNLVETIDVRGRTQIDRSLWERFRLGGVLEQHGVDVVHGTKHLIPRTGLPTVLTVHDVLAITWPQQYALAKRMLLPAQFRASLKQATVLVSVSGATAERLTALDPAFGAKTIVAQNGLSIELLTVAPRPPRTPPPGRFALVVGDLSPRKNVSLLVRIWERVAAATGGLHLVAVGPDGWRSAATRRGIEDLARRGIAAWARHVTDEELRWYYEHAAVVLAPAIEEGFGLPVGEALALGAPVVASTDRALVEVAQGRAVHVAPDDPEGWVTAVVAAAVAPKPEDAPPVFATWTAHAARVVEAYGLARQRHGTRR